MATRVDVDAISANGFGLAEDLDAFESDWHRHGRHQLLYAASGALHLEVADGQWLLPPQRAAFLPAGLSHQVRARRTVTLRTVYLQPRLVDRAGKGCRVFAVGSLGREMILSAMSWGPSRDPADKVANLYFRTLGALLENWMQDERPYKLPRAKSAKLDQAMRFALDHLDTPNVDLRAAAKAAGLSTRSLARRFRLEAQTTWRGFLHQARMLHAMELLAAGHRVTDSALAVGFESVAAFTRAFRGFAGELPKDYRRHQT